MNYWSNAWRFCSPVLCILTMTIAVLNCHAGVVTLPSIRDNVIFQENLSNSNGQGYLFAGDAGGGGIRRALLKFDATATIPAGAQIQSVQLNLHVSRASFASPLPASLHKTLADWGEGNSNAGERSGGGAPAQAGDATWVARFFGGALWTTSGGDFVPAASWTGELGGIGIYTLNSTPQLIADVQGWLDNSASNFGWILRGDESQPGTARRIDSRELSDPTLRPSLIVTYTDPPPLDPKKVPLPPWSLIVLGLLLTMFGYLADSKLDSSRSIENRGPASGKRVEETH